MVRLKFSRDVSAYMPFSSDLSEKAMAWTTKSMLPQAFSSAPVISPTVARNRTAWMLSASRLPFTTSTARCSSVNSVRPR